VPRWAREHGCPWAEDIEDAEETDNMNCCLLAAGGVEVGAAARLPVERDDLLRKCRFERALGGVAVGAGAPLPVVGRCRLTLSNPS